MGKFDIFFLNIGFVLCANAESLSRLNAVIKHPNALQPENVMAYDNAVSALGKICQFHRESIDSAQVNHFVLISMNHRSGY